MPSLVNPKDQLSALVMSGTAWEQSILKKTFINIVNSCLYGDYGEGRIHADLRDLKPFDDQTFDYVHASGVLDFILEIDKVLTSVYRVLKPNGQFLFHILSHRLRDDDSPPTVEGTKRETYYPEGVVLPSIMYGKKDILRRMNQHRFSSEMVEMIDPFSGEHCTWFWGQKI
ncbi:class I SAM-dependent methyltransferase [Paenibacillus xerothermodurans]|uniref:class I SAM-dependent methyltransferase n=1 Tax=Paenibacillus xerothermodurans TaxID=1977292 RepID=UPI0014036BC5|nr:class I SAM-dependent methyltransferase [Paenibacillus xerothermodurans]